MPPAGSEHATRQSCEPMPFVPTERVLQALVELQRRCEAVDRRPADMEELTEIGRAVAVRVERKDAATGAPSFEILTHFHSGVVPETPLSKLIAGLFARLRGSVSPETVLAGITLLHRFEATTGMPVCMLMAHRLLIGATFVAAKLLQDVRPPVANFARAVGVTPREMLRLERQLAKGVGWHLLVDASQLLATLGDLCPACDADQSAPLVAIHEPASMSTTTDERGRDRATMRDSGSGGVAPRGATCASQAGASFASPSRASDGMSPATSADPGTGASRRWSRGDASGNYLATTLAGSVDAPGGSSFGDRLAGGASVMSAGSPLSR
uniref:Cyclin N-terminal domain-containing protein n=1 Tax=Neobodo designis TaxID=312471 RepID=A0A7S1Q049_NEODS|mmetsp:Transcript_27293/g.84581  ORF Transcript_27293/g.84581 Transcript_27293/m.84581 type:complete len:326 (+) Transcript_27293:382-1359(+)